MRTKYFLLILLLLAPNAVADVPVSKDAIAFSKVTNGYWQIWTVDPNGNNLVQRTFSPKDKRFPVWEPGAEKILFTTNNN